MASNNNNHKNNNNNNDNIICCVCMNVFSRSHVPIQLACYHPIGEQCFTQLLKDPKLCRCPICRNPIASKTDVNSLPKNDVILYITQFIDENKNKLEEEQVIYCDICEDPRVAIVKCDVCNEMLCQTHMDAHKMGKKTKDHGLVQLNVKGSGGGSNKCHEHPLQELFFVCNDKNCGKLLCGLCVASGKHSNYEPIQKWMEKNKGKTNQYDQYAAERFDTLQTRILTEKEKYQRFKTAKNKCREELDSYFIEMEKMVVQLHRDTIGLFELNCREAEMKWEKQMDNMQDECIIAQEIQKMLKSCNNNNTTTNQSKFSQILNLSERQFNMWNDSTYTIPIESVDISCKLQLPVKDFKQTIQNSIKISLDENPVTVHFNINKSHPKVNALYSCGRNDCGQLGLKSTTKSENRYKAISIQIPDTLLQIACGGDHTLALSRNVIYLNE